MSNIVLNEVVGSTTSTDVEFIELFGEAGASLAGLSVIIVESDAQSSRGRIDARFDFSDDAVLGDNGFFLLGNDLVFPTYAVSPDAEIARNFIENSSYTIALVETVSLPSDGVITDENQFDVTVLDSVFMTDGGANDVGFLGAPAFGPFEGGSFRAVEAGFNRLVDGFDTDSTSDLVVADFGNDPEVNSPTSGDATPPPPPQDVAIYDIQGAGHVSAFEDQGVRTTGVVTALASNGFYLQDPEGDDDIATSDAIFVRSSQDVAVGDVLRVTGVVFEVDPSGGGADLDITTLVATVNGVEVLDTGVDLPEAVLLGDGGRLAPTETFDDDNFTSFDPETDGVDFFESLEGMLVTAQDLVAVAGTNQFGEIFAVTDNGQNATGLSERGTLNISADDFNPEKIQIDTSFTTSGFDNPLVNVGDQLGDVTGVVSYTFGNYEIIPTIDFSDQVVTPGDDDGRDLPKWLDRLLDRYDDEIPSFVTKLLDKFGFDTDGPDVPIVPETTDIVGDANTLTIATYNVLNLDPVVEVQENTNGGQSRNVDDDIGDGRFDAIAKQIVENLNAPDIIGLQEVQDNSGGEIDDGIVSASVTLKTLVDAISAAGGPNYAFLDNVFIADQASGGQPGGNIRTAFLYNPDRVEFVPGSLETIGGQGDGEAFEGARLPLVAQFDFGGEIVTVINNHFSSKGGSAPIAGLEQPFEERQEDLSVNGSLDERQRQSEAVQQYVAGLLEADPSAKVMVVGDLNEFEFVSPVKGLEDAGLTNLTNMLPEDERYSFIFQGNSQSLDHILVSDDLLDGVQVDVVHTNTEFAATSSRASDHDPVVAAVNFDIAPVANNDSEVIDLSRRWQTIEILDNDTDGVRLASINGHALRYSERLDKFLGANRINVETDDGTLKIRVKPNGDVQVKADRGVETASFTYTVTDGELESEEATVLLDDVFTLEILHLADQEAGEAAITDAPNASAVLNALEMQDLGNDGVFDNTLRLSSGDAIIPGLFFEASVDAFGGAGRADILIQNELSFDAITLGNHEFDLGTEFLAGLISADPVSDYEGALFPYLSANLDFSTDANLAPLETAGGQAPRNNSVSTSVVIDVNGEKIGVVGSTTPNLGQISSPGDVGIGPFEFDTSTFTVEQLQALAAEIQTEVDALTAQGVNKIVLMSHYQSLANEENIAQFLSDVDVIIGGGSNSLLVDENDVLRAGDDQGDVDGPYPIFTTDADGNPVAIVNTDGNYRYVGRLVVDFDENGIIIPESYDSEVSGAYATDAAGVAALGAEGLIDPEIQEIVDKIQIEVDALKETVIGYTDVYLDGMRGSVRTEETNMGNLTADANLAYAKAFDPTVLVSLKNGGGIRDDIGTEAGNLPPEGGEITIADHFNVLRFNNDLVLATLTHAQLKDVLEHAVSATADGNTPGQFAQVSGVSFSFDALEAPGNRIVNAAVTDENGEEFAVVVDGVVVDPDSAIRIVTLGFLAGGGDGYPYQEFASEDSVFFDFVELDNGQGIRTGNATFADDGTEQDALAEYLIAEFGEPETAFNDVETLPELDERIQNLAFREDTVLSDGPEPLVDALVLSDTFIL